MDGNDINKVNQDRVNSSVKVEKITMIDNDSDSEYDIASIETYYKLDNESYMLSPNKRGFDIQFNNNHSKFIKVAKVWNTSSGNHYLVHEKENKGIGYFDTEGNFVVEYYNKDLDLIETKTYRRTDLD